MFTTFSTHHQVYASPQDRRAEKWGLEGGDCMNRWQLEARKVYGMMESPPEKDVDNEPRGGEVSSK